MSRRDTPESTASSKSPASSTASRATPRKFEPRRPENPRRIRNGIKARRKPDDAFRQWIARRWADMLPKIFDNAVLAEGYEYARTGQTASLTIDPGKVIATVQGRAPKPYKLTIRFSTVDAANWRALIQAMASEAVFAAHLLAGELPEATDRLWATLEESILPSADRAMTCTCSCADPDPCKHAAAIAHLLIDTLEADPFTIFTLRGRHSEQVLDQFRQDRALHTHGIAAAHSDPMIPETRAEVKPLEDCLDEFWRAGHRLAELHAAPPLQHVNHALLRRLGPSPLNGRFPMVGLLASIYDHVSQEALSIRNEAEQIDQD
jgi:uncharacterized Zn finger protein